MTPLCLAAVCGGHAHVRCRRCSTQDAYARMTSGSHYDGCAASRAAGLINFGQAQSSLERKEEAAEKFEEAVGLKPTLARAYGMLGNSRAEARRLHEASYVLKHAVRLDPEDAQVRALCGSACSSLI